MRPLGEAARLPSLPPLGPRARAVSASSLDLNGARISGLLPRGSLTGFYLPLYNLPRVFSLVVGCRYALDYASASGGGCSGGGFVPSPGMRPCRSPEAPSVRRLHVDDHAIPLGGRW